MPAAITKALDSFSAGYPQELVFLHTDRSTYAGEESIWFKAYCTLNGQPSLLSRILYVELVDANNTVYEKRMLPLSNGTAHGDIFLKADLPTGTYSLNGYTLWMANFPESVFRKKIGVVNTTNDASLRVRTNGDYDVKFFPEGGALLQGLSNRVAFKAVGADGLPVKVSGEIVDSKGNKVGLLQTQHAGMGEFDMLPNPSESYVARVNVNGKDKSFEIPPAKNEGVLFQVNNASETRIFFQVSRTPQFTASNRLSVIGTMQNTVVFSGEVNFEQGTTAGSIPKKNLPPGVLQLTLFGENKLPLAERLVFVSNLAPQPTLQIDSVSTAKRGKNKFSIDLSQYKSLSASVSVTSVDADSSTNEENLLTHLLLNSEVRGYIDNPGYYFKGGNPSAAKHLDLVMMTHGWRSIGWQKLFAYNFPAISFPVESDITVRGRITKPNGKDKFANSKLNFITKTADSTTILSSLTLTGQDQFVLSGLNFKKAATIFYQGTDADKFDALTKVSVLPSHFDTLKTSTNSFAEAPIQGAGKSPYFTDLHAAKAALLKQEGKTLENITIKTKRLKPVDSVSALYASPLFSTSDQNIYITERLTNIWRFLQANISGINVGRNEVGATTVFFTRQLPGSTQLLEGELTDPTTNIQFFLNEIIVTKDVIESMDPADIILVKVWKGTSALALGTEHRVIALYTNNQKSAASWKNKGFNSYKKEGYSVSRQFYTMDYDVQPTGEDTKDIRGTLYWNHELKVNDAGKTVFGFSNDDLAKRFKIVLQGVDKEGKIIFVQKIVD